MLLLNFFFINKSRFKGYISISGDKKRLHFYNTVVSYLNKICSFLFFFRTSSVGILIYSLFTQEGTSLDLQAKTYPTQRFALRFHCINDWNHSRKLKKKKKKFLLSLLKNNRRKKFLSLTTFSYMVMWTWKHDLVLSLQGETFSHQNVLLPYCFPSHC